MQPIFNLLPAPRKWQNYFSPLMLRPRTSGKHHSNKQYSSTTVTVLWYQNVSTKDYGTGIAKTFQVLQTKGQMIPLSSLQFCFFLHSYFSPSCMGVSRYLHTRHEQVSSPKFNEISLQTIMVLDSSAVKNEFPLRSGLEKRQLPIKQDGLIC